MHFASVSIFFLTKQENATLLSSWCWLIGGAAVSKRARGASKSDVQSRTVPGGVTQYVAWSPTAIVAGATPGCQASARKCFRADAACCRVALEDFFVDPACRESYKRNALNILSRVNSLNGRRYRDDPTIMSWVRGHACKCFTL